MAENQNKVYVNGFFLKNQTINGQNGEYNILKLRVDIKKILPFLEQYKNDAGFVYVDIRERKEVGQYGDTHYAVLNTFVPTANGDATTASKTDDKSKPKPSVSNSVSVAADDDIPF